MLHNMHRNFDHMILSTRTALLLIMNSITFRIQSSNMSNERPVQICF